MSRFGLESNYQSNLSPTKSFSPVKRQQADKPVLKKAPTVGTISMNSDFFTTGSPDKKQVGFGKHNIAPEDFKPELFRTQYGELTVDQLNEQYAETEQACADLERKKRHIVKSKASKKDKQHKLKPIEDELRQVRLRMLVIYHYRDEKTPLHQKLPKGSQYTNHYMCNMYTSEIDTAGKQTKQTD